MTNITTTATPKTFNLKTKQGRLFKALIIEGQALSPAAITNRFGIKNPTATISHIRHGGYAIHSNRYKARNGVVLTAYQHGATDRKMVAYQASAKASVKA